jgi:hypothetical protein
VLLTNCTEFLSSSQNQNNSCLLIHELQSEETLVRAVLVAAVLLGSSSLYPSIAQDRANSPTSSQPQTVPVQPERTPQQSEQARAQDEKRAEDVRVRSGWRAEERDSSRTDRMGQNEMGRMRGHMGRDDERDDRTVGRNWRMRGDEDPADRDRYGRSYYNDRPQRRVKICIQYEDGDEYCRYRD